MRTKEQYNRDIKEFMKYFKVKSKPYQPRDVDKAFLIYLHSIQKTMKSELEIRQIYYAEYGKPRKEAGFSITVKKSQKGNWVVTLWYEPNSFRCEKEHTIVYNKEGVKL